ncbi:SCP2 sterol-binding domain-containing protein [Sphingosinicella soli]|uniref:Putative sterol carrier protein n=1 Tax=Sphingosinicella soli TaxID=333708 RepID=A0A7W7FAG2_9SPHN|nr:SCP2 sterol-binding domain-containing protein [Sphingosinicella soli]MBB4633653.1 putative sterol carrier protein [Sphingosinicella soli]
MSLAEITEKMRSRVGDSAGLGKSVKFDFGDDGIVRIDDTGSPAVVDNQDLPVDCTVKVSMSDFLDIVDGTTNPQMAFMTGKLKVEGDMSVALQLGKVLG